MTCLTCGRLLDEIKQQIDLRADRLELRLLDLFNKAADLVIWHGLQTEHLRQAFSERKAPQKSHDVANMYTIMPCLSARRHRSHTTWPKHTLPSLA